MKKSFLFLLIGIGVSLLVIGFVAVRIFHIPFSFLSSKLETISIETIPNNKIKLPAEAQGEVILKISNMEANMQIESPLQVLGEAPGSWYFEGSFVVKVVDVNMKVLGQGNAVAKGEWTTPAFVPFEVNVPFEKSSTKNGFVIFEKSNPSGEADKAEEYKLPIRF